MPFLSLADALKATAHSHTHTHIEIMSVRRKTFRADIQTYMDEHTFTKVCKRAISAPPPHLMCTCVCASEPNVWVAAGSFEFILTPLTPPPPAPAKDRWHEDKSALTYAYAYVSVSFRFSSSSSCSCAVIILLRPLCVSVRATFCCDAPAFT